MKNLKRTGNKGHCGPERKSVRILLPLLAALLIAVSAGCSLAGSGGYYSDVDDWPEPGAVSGIPGLNQKTDSYAPEGTSAETQIPDEAEQKLIKRVNLNGETRTFDDMTAELEAALKEAGGYYQNFSVSASRYDGTRVLEAVARVPADKLDTFMTRTGNAFSVRSKTEEVSDVSAQYYDTKARMDTMVTKRDALQEMMSKAKGVEELLEIQDRLYDTIADIEAMQATLNRLDSLVSYSTVTMSVYEVAEYSEAGGDSYGTRIKNAFVSSWRSFARGCGNFFVWFVGAIPGLLVFAAIVVAAVLIIKHCVKKSRERKRRQYEFAGQQYVQAQLAQQAQQTQQDPAQRQND